GFKLAERQYENHESSLRSDIVGIVSALGFLILTCLLFKAIKFLRVKTSFSCGLFLPRLYPLAQIEGDSLRAETTPALPFKALGFEDPVIDQACPFRLTGGA